MHGSETAPRHRWLGGASSVLLLAALLGPAVAARPAGGDPLADKKAEAARLAKELEDQGRQVSVLAERLNQARLAADRLSEQVRTAETDLAAADRDVAAVRARLRDRAVASYVGGQPIPMEQLLVSGSINDVLVRETYVATVAGQEQDLAGSLDEARERRRQERADLEAARGAATAVLADVEAQRDRAAQAAAAQKATLDRVQGELASLVEAERVRRAEEEARRVQAELAARREREAREEAARVAAREAAAREAASRLALESARRTTSTRATVTTLPGDEPSGDGDVPPPAPGAEAAVAEARRQLGKPYEYGADGPDSFDCSGLTMWAWRAGGRTLPHSSAAQYSATRRVSVTEIMPGDLVFYGSPIHHVGIYAGAGLMVEASETGTPVRTASIYRRDLVGVGRVG